MYNNELYHHGILGQKWGVRRFQNPDGTLTSEGKKRLHDRKDYELGQLKKRSEKADADAKYYKKQLELVKEKGVDSEEVQNNLSYLDIEELKLLAAERAERTNDPHYNMEKAWLKDGVTVDTIYRLASEEVLESTIDGLEHDYSRSISAGKDYLERYNKLMNMDVEKLAEEVGYRKAHRKVTWA